MGTTDTGTTTVTPPRPCVYVYGGERLIARVTALGWQVTRVDAAGAESARGRGVPVVGEEVAALSDDRLAAALSGRMAEYLLTQLDSLRAEARKTSHDGKNAVGLLWMTLATLERTVGRGEAVPPEIKELIEEVKVETRTIVGLLDQLSTSAKRPL